MLLDLASNSSCAALPKTIRSCRWNVWSYSCKDLRGFWSCLLSHSLELCQILFLYFLAALQALDISFPHYLNNASLSPLSRHRASTNIKQDIFLLLLLSLQTCEILYPHLIFPFFLNIGISGFKHAFPFSSCDYLFCILRTLLTLFALYSAFTLWARACVMEAFAYWRSSSLCLIYFSLLPSITDIFTVL